MRATVTAMTTRASAPAVLLVDDRSENLLSLEALLEPLALETGVRLLRANNADEALRHLLKEGDAIALVLLDVLMPGTGGIETASLIRQRTRNEHVPIIFITALESDRRRVTLGYQSGAVDYLTKPIQPDVLIAKVRAFLELHQRRGDAVLEERRRYADQVHVLREQSLRDEAALVETLQRVGTALASELDLERVVQLVTDEAMSLTRAQFAVFGPGFRGDAVVRSDDITEDPRRDTLVPYDGMPRGDRPVRSYLAVPVSSRSGEVIGGLFFGHESPGVFGEREERLVVGIAGWAAVAMDNARLYAAERQAREGAEGASRAKAEFLATMSHEFRTPLNAIVGYAQLLDMGVLGPATPAQHAHLERLQASAKHLLQLVDDVLDVAKVDADRLDVRRDLLMTGAAVAAAVTLVQPQATAKGVRLMDLHTSEPGFAYVGDEHRVRQVVINLLSNAVKFTPSGGEVTVDCGLASDPGPGALTHSSHEESASEQVWVCIKVEDTGPGIAPSLIDHLFEPFVQGDGALTREQGGTGLGLAISRRLARLMGGDVTVSSEHGSRTTFALWLPAASGSEATAGPEQAMDIPERKALRGASALSEGSVAPLDAAAYDVLQALSVRLAADAETIAERYVAALRADGRFPGVLHLPAVQLRDHVTPFVGLLASQLMVIGETRGQAPDLLRDGGQIQRAMSELHGAQRFRLGWSEADVERETSLLLDQIVKALEHAGDPGDTPRVTSAAGGATQAIPAESVHVATDYATVVSRHVLKQAARNSLRSFRFAKSADAP